MIRQDNGIAGIAIPGNDNHVKILQYADDGILCLNDEHEMDRAIHIIDDFGLLAGMKLNLSKCEGLWLGSAKDRQANCSLYGIKWPTEPIRCLGIYIGHDHHANNVLNWDHRIDQIRNLLTSWKGRELTLFGKIIIIKQLAIPKVLFSASMLSVPDGIVNELNTMFYEFIWGRVDRIKRDVLINDYKNGGLKMVDVETLFASIKASWVVRLVYANPDDMWPMVARFYFRYNDNNLLYRLNCITLDSFSVLKNIPCFYKSVYESFMKAKCITYETFCDSILDQPLWGTFY